MAYVVLAMMEYCWSVFLVVFVSADCFYEPLQFRQDPAEDELLRIVVGSIRNSSELNVPKRLDVVVMTTIHTTLHFQELVTVFGF